MKLDLSNLNLSDNAKWVVAAACAILIVLVTHIDLTFWPWLDSLLSTRAGMVIAIAVALCVGFSCGLIWDRFMSPAIYSDPEQHEDDLLAIEEFPEGPFRVKMEELHVDRNPRRLVPTAKRIAAFEKFLGVRLPEDYRRFLESYGGTLVSATYPIQEPSPVGTGASVGEFYGFEECGYDLPTVSKNFDGGAVVTPIARDDGGNLVVLFLSGKYVGKVYFWDANQRSLWSDEQFRSWFPNLAPEIESYLALRATGKLPKKSRGMESFYFVAPTFTEFLLSCTYWNIDEGAAEKEHPENRRLRAAFEAREFEKLEHLDTYRTPDGLSLAQFAASIGDVKPLEWLVARNIPMNGAIFHATLAGHVDAIQFLLNNGCDVNERGKDGNTPLSAVVDSFGVGSDQKLRIVRFLVERGADVNARNDNGETVLQRAGGERNSEGRPQAPRRLIAILESKGARLDP